MYTGLQRDMETHGFRPALFINKIDVTYNGKPVMTADTNIGISEESLDPVRFPCRPAGRPASRLARQ
jgi:hypothetical protein